MMCVEKTRLDPVSISALTIRQVNFAKEAEKLLTENLARRESITGIANQLGVGASSLKNWFRSVFGKSISEYMRDLRIQEAKRLLSDSALPLRTFRQGSGMKTKQSSQRCFINIVDIRQQLIANNVMGFQI